MVLLQRKLYFSKDPEGVQHFFLGGGATCDFPGGGSGPAILPPPPSCSAHEVSSRRKLGNTPISNNRWHDFRILIH